MKYLIWIKGTSLIFNITISEAIDFYDFLGGDKEEIIQEVKKEMNNEGEKPLVKKSTLKKKNKYLLIH